MADREQYPKCFDPYLRYAISTEFRDFEFFEESRLFFLVEFKQAGAAGDFEHAMIAPNPPGQPHPDRAVEVGPADEETRYVTVRGKRAAVEPSAFYIWENFVSRVELSLPLKPSSPVVRFKKTVFDRSDQLKDPPGSLLIGVLDDGCPFAAAHFLKASASTYASTRVRAIWDQNQSKQPIEIYDSQHKHRFFGQTLRDFGYGLEFWRDFAASLDIDAGGRPLIGLDDWMALHLTPAGSIDEDGCYADARFTSLARRESHGAHVMDVFAGRFPTSARIGPTHPSQDRRAPRTGRRQKPIPTLLTAPTWCSCNSPMTASVMRPAYGSRRMFSTALGTSCRLPTRTTPRT